MKKNILIDIYKIKDLHSGLGQFSYNFAQEISQQNLDYQLHFLAPKTDIEFNHELNIVKESLSKRYLPNSNPDYDIWHSLHQFPSHFPNSKTKQILTIHDLNFLVEKEGSKRKKYIHKLQKNVDRAEVITCISNFTKMELLEHIDINNKEIHVIHNGISLKTFPLEESLNFGIKNKFFFSLSVFKEMKNFESIIAMMDQFPEHQLVIAGNNDTAYGKKMKLLIQNLGLDKQIILSGKITEKEKFFLYQNCEAFLFPSKAEGFGMPPIEAMMCGKLVFLSRYASLPEIGEGAAFFFDSFDKIDMANCIKSGLFVYKNNPQMSVSIKKHANQFQWENCIKQYADLYKKILG